MKGDEKTLKELEDALDRIINGNPEHISPERKLSVSAVEAEAQMGNGSAYYYPELTQKVKKIKKQQQSGQDGAVSRSISHRYEDECQKSAKYFKEITELRERMSRMAADRHQVAEVLARLLIEKQNEKDESVKNRRKSIGLIKPQIPVLDPEVTDGCLTMSEEHPVK